MRRLRPVDILITLLFLSAAALCFNLFRLDLRRTLTSRDQEPVGAIIIKNNIVQRRLADRVVWDRLFADSPVYSGDLIRVASLSAANLNIDNASLDLGENTLIRIVRSLDGDGSFRLELSGGSLSIDTAGAGGNFTLDLMGREVRAVPGTVLAAAAGDDGMVLQVSEGSVTVTGDGETREVTSGAMLSLDTEGTERTGPAVVMTVPRSNARYLKSSGDPLPVDFAWTRLYLEPDEPLCLEIASDRSFTRIARAIETVDASAQAALTAGLWYWRMSCGGAVLSSDRFTITDGSSITLISPAMNSVFLYNKDLPSLRFQWTEMENASHYIIEVSETRDFANPRISRELTSAFFTDSTLWPGTWHWRVQPVFSSAYESSVKDAAAIYSQSASFRIERGEADQLVVILPEAGSDPITAEEPPPPLAAPLNRRPANGHRIGIEELRTGRSLTFSWSPVTEANAYIFTLYQQTSGGRRQINRIGPQSRASWTLENIAVLQRGTYIWQAEAVSRNSSGVIERRGIAGENTFTLDVPSPGAPQVEDAGRFYGD